jgi:pimeloyl-ACP methyl ester carboxylesterase
MTAREVLVALALSAAGLACGAAPASGAAASPPDRGAKPPVLGWAPCGDAANVTCAKLTVPRDYERPHGATFRLFVSRSAATDPAHRIGSLLVNPGGPGASIADAVQALGADFLPALNRRFDIVAMDPRGVGQSTPSIDCAADPETAGIYAQPFTTPSNLDPSGFLAKVTRYVTRCTALNRDVLAFVSTADVARDMDMVRRALGEQQITYVGFSYGTVLGATYARLFPKGYRAMVLDGPVDVDAYFNDPQRQLSAQTAGFERALGRFEQACAREPQACSGFGGGDPSDAFDALLDRLDAGPVRVADGRAVDGDDARAGTMLALYSKASWPFLGAALADLDRGDGELMRLAADLFYGRNPDGTYQPGQDRYFTIGAVEQSYPRDVGTYLRAGQRSWDEHEHFWWNNGYPELNYGRYPVRSSAVFTGPFRIAPAAFTPLVVATTYDPATPYRGAQNLVRDLGNARLLTRRGDGHTAYGAGSACIDGAVDAYVERRVLPAVGSACVDDPGFGAARGKALVAGVAQHPFGPHARPSPLLR